MSTIALPPSCTFKGCIKSPSPLASLKSISKAFGLKSSSCYRTTAMAVHKVKLISPDGKEAEFEAPDDAYILDSAEKNAKTELPYTCRVGSCSSCLGLIVSGSVDQSDGSFLDDSLMEKGYVLTCIAYPTSDCVIQTHKESDVF